MIALEPPSLPVFVSVQPVLDIEVTSQRLSSIAAIQAHYIVMLHRSPH